MSDQPLYDKLIIDAHLDLSMNAMEWNRDLRLSTEEIRDLEKDLSDKPDRGKSTVSFPSMRQGGVHLCVATLIARYTKPGHILPSWNSPEQAWAQTSGQLAWYRSMEEEGHLRQISNLEGLEDFLNQRQSDSANDTIGYILSLEGADSIVTLDHLHRRYEEGLRAVGPAHYGPATYAHGTDSEGGIGEKGKALLREMESLGIILDATHLCDQSFWEAMDTFNGSVWASHSNCRSLVNHNRQFSDEQIKVLIDRKAVIGMAFDAWMIVPHWIRGKSNPLERHVTLDSILDHLDHICQIAGNANHVAMGTDLDGGFGKEQCPSDLETIADLRKIPALLANRGYSASDIDDIMSGNWLQFLRRAWG